MAKIFKNNPQALEECKKLKKLYLPEVQQFFGKPAVGKEIRNFLAQQEAIDLMPEPDKVRYWLMCSFVALNGSKKFASKRSANQAQTQLMPAAQSPTPDRSANMQIVLKRFDEINHRLTAMCTRIEQIAEHLGMEESVPW